MENQKKAESFSFTSILQNALKIAIAIIGYFIVQLLGDIKSNTAKLETIADRTDSNTFQIRVQEFILKNHEVRLSSVEIKADNTEKKVSILEQKVK